MSTRRRQALDAEYLERARREALRRDYRLLTPGQRVEQAIALSKEMTKLAARHEDVLDLQRLRESREGA